MIIYLIVFFISIYTTWLAEKSTKQKPIFFILSCIAILIPCILAGCRDSGIGTDTLIYVDECWNRIISTKNWDDLIKSYNQEVFDSIEPVYLLINWIASLFGKEIQWAYFMTNLCVVLPIYCAAYDNRKKAPMWLSMTLFFLLYYNASLNLVRQSIALAFCIYSYKYLEQKKWIKALIWVFIIINTHNTGIFYLAFVAIFIIWNTMKKKNLRKILLIISATILPLLLAFFNYIIIATVMIGILPSKYLMYISEENNETIGKSVGFIYFIIALTLLYIKKYQKHRNDHITDSINYYLYNKFYGITLFGASFISKWAFRISYYFNYPVDCIFLPRTIYSIKKKNKTLYYLITSTIICFLLIMWYWLVVIRKENATIPYKSKLLGI